MLKIQKRLIVAAIVGGIAASSVIRPSEASTICQPGVVEMTSAASGIYPIQPMPVRVLPPCIERLHCCDFIPGPASDVPSFEGQEHVQSAMILGILKYLKEFGWITINAPVEDERDLPIVTAGWVENLKNLLKIIL